MAGELVRDPASGAMDPGGTEGETAAVGDGAPAASRRPNRRRHLLQTLAVWSVLLVCIVWLGMGHPVVTGLLFGALAGLPGTWRLLRSSDLDFELEMPAEVHRETLARSICETGGLRLAEETPAAERRVLLLETLETLELRRTERWGFAAAALGTLAWAVVFGFGVAEGAGLASLWPAVAGVALFGGLGVGAVWLDRTRRRALAQVKDELEKLAGADPRAGEVPDRQVTSEVER